MEETTLQDTEHLRRLLRRCGHFLYHQHNHGQQGTVLAMLAQFGPMNQRELQQKLSIKPGSVSELISKLEDKGCVDRTRDEKDRRRVVITLTEKGACIARIHQERPDETLFSALDPAEQAQLTALMEKLLGSWDLL